MAAESNTYNDYSAAATESYALISNFSHWLEPERSRQLYDVNPMETDFMDFMKMGLMKQVDAEEIFHREKNSRFDTPKVNTSTTQASVYGASASTGNGDPASETGLAYIQLHPDSHTPGADDLEGKYSYPRVGEHIKFKNGAEFRIHGKRTSVDSAHRLYLQPVNASQPTLANTITLVGSTYGGDIFIVMGTSFEDATLGQTTGLIPTHKVKQSYLQSFADIYTVNSFQEGTKTYPINYKGQDIQFHYELGLQDMEINLAKKIDNSLFFGQKDDGNLTNLDPETGVENAVTTTQSYMSSLDLNAQKLYYDTTPTVALFMQLNRYRRKLQQGPRSILWVGYEFRSRIESLVTQLGVNGGLVYNRKAVDLNIQQISQGGFEYNIKSMKIFDDPKFGGAPGFPYPYYFFVQPMLKINGSQNGRTGAGEMLDAFQIRYKKAVGVGARGYYKIVETGMNSRSGSGINKRRNREISIDMRLGAQTVGASQHILGLPA